MAEDGAKAATLPADVERIVKDVARARGFVRPRLSVSPGSAVGDGYLSDILRVVVRDGDEDEQPADVAQQQQQQLDLIVKTPAATLHNALAEHAFSAEAFAYKTLLPALEEVARMQEPLPWPRCFHAAAGASSSAAAAAASSSSGEPKAAIVLGDLRPQGFAMVRRPRKMLDAAHASLALQQLGRLHGAGLALRRLRPEAFGRARVALAANYWGLPEQRRDARPFHAAMLSAVPGVIKDKFPSDVVARVEQLLARCTEDQTSLMLCDHQDSDDDPRPGYTFIHNDCTSNNVMFQYGEGGAVLGCRLIDFQLAWYGCAALDVAAMLFVSVDRAARAAHWDDLVRGYHDGVLATLRDAGCDEDDVYPWDVFQAQLASAAPYGACMAAFYYPGLYGDADTRRSVGDYKAARARGGDAAAFTFAVKDDFAERATGVVQDLVDRDWLPH